MKLAVQIFVCFFILPANLVAQENDYEPFDSSWVGLSEFVRTAEQSGVQLNVVDSVDFSTMSPDEPLVVIYPKQELHTAQLASWVVDGGRMLLADDFGVSDSLLERLEIERFSPAIDSLPHAQYFDGTDAAPVFSPRGKHDLLDGVERLVANHPSVIVNEGGPVVQYDDGGGLVYDMNLGEGKVIVVADPSMFINGVIALEDNRRFAQNTLRYICRDTTPCKVTLLRKTFAQNGVYRNPDLLDGGVERFIESVNELLSDLPKHIGTELLFVLSLFLLFGLGGYSVAILPIVESRRYSGYISDFVGAFPPPQSEFDWNVSRFGTASSAIQDLLPMSILKQVFEEIVLEDFGLWPLNNDDRPSVEEIVELVSNRYLIDTDDASALQGELTELLAVLATTPPRHRVFLENETNLRRGDLLKYHRIAIEILTLMGKKDEYDRRTWGTT